MCYSRSAVLSTEQAIMASVLICCGSSSSSASPSAVSGSGFLVETQDGPVVLTGAAWLSDSLTLTLFSPSGSKQDSISPATSPAAGCKSQHDILTGASSTSPINRSNDSLIWKMNSKHFCHFTVLLQNSASHTEDRGSVLFLPAEVHGVYLMPTVMTSLSEQLSSLSHWRCSTGLEEQKEEGGLGGRGGGGGGMDIDMLLLPLSCVVILKLCESYQSMRLSSLTFSSAKLRTGDPVCVVGTPFGNFCPEVFLNCHSNGNVVKELGERERNVVVMDAGYLPGYEGALVFDERSSQLPVGMVLTTLHTPNGDTAGLSLACSIASILEALPSHLTPHLYHSSYVQSTPTSSALKTLPLLNSSIPGVVVAIATKGSWGTGLLVAADTVLTCGHMIKQCRDQVTVKFSFLLSSNQPGCQATVLFHSDIPDMALLQLSIPVTDPRVLAALEYNITTFAHPGRMDECNREGSPIIIIGYGLQDPSKCPSVPMPLVTRGIVSKAVRCGGKEVMVVTTALVHPGMSGGMVLCGLTGRLLAMVVSNSRDQDTSSSYPRINYCLPLSWILPPVLSFLSTSDLALLRQLSNNCPPEIKSIWKLESKLQNQVVKRSKL